MQKTRFLGRADVGLRAGMQLDGRQVQFQQAHVLNDQRVGAGVVDLPGHVARALQLIVAQDGVERDEDAAAKAVRVFDQAIQVADVVARRGACAKGRAADVDGIGAVVNGRDADVGVAGGGQQFKLVGQKGHGAALSRLRWPCAGRAEFCRTVALGKKTG